MKNGPYNRYARPQTIAAVRSRSKSLSARSAHSVAPRMPQRAWTATIPGMKWVLPLSFHHAATSARCGVRKNPLPGVPHSLKDSRVFMSSPGTRL